MKVGDQDPYVKLPIEVRTEGLSPDSTYLIPLRIASCTPYEVNKDKSRVLYKVYIENDFYQSEKSFDIIYEGHSGGKMIQSLHRYQRIRFYIPCRNGV